MRRAARRRPGHRIEQGPTLDRFQHAVTRRLPSTGLLDEIAMRWTAIESELEAVWSERWRDLAPGSDVLTYQGESRMLDSSEGICAGQSGFEYPATSVPFSNFGLYG